MSSIFDDAALAQAKTHTGKLSVTADVTLDSKDDLSTAYTPGVAAVCLAIADDPSKASELTIKGRTIAVVSDGSAVLGLGNIGPEAAMPVMEGKCALFKKFGNVDAFPICLDTQDSEEIIETVKRLAPTFGGINLEDISAPRCFEIERALDEALDIPVFHDDQHGTAIVVAAAVINAYRLIGRELSEVKAVINGAGAAGSAIAKLLLAIGVNDIVLCDSKGAIHSTREGLAEDKRELATLLKEKRGYGFPIEVQTLAQAVVGRDLFIGVSVADALTPEMVKSMNSDPVIFAMANPVPEILPAVALEAGARVVGTGRSDFANQINNVLVFPGIFAGALAAGADSITEEMKLAAAYALAAVVTDAELTEEFVIPDALDVRAADAVKAAILKIAA